MARFQLDMSEEGLKELEFLMTKTGTTTKKEYVNNALTILKWAIRQCENGCTIASVNEDKNIFRELEMPIFDHVRTKVEFREAGT